MVAFGFASVTTQAQLVIPNTSTITLDFDAFTGSGFAPSPSAGQLDSDTWRATGFGTAPGDMAFGDTATAGDFARGSGSIGSVTSGGVYALDIGSGDIAFGVQPGVSDFTPGTFTLRIQNTTGSTINSLAVAYDIVSWNNGDQGNSFNFAHSGDDSTYTSVGALDFATGIAADVTPALLTTARSTTITGLSLANNDFFYLQWQSDRLIGGSGTTDDEFGLNDLSITATVIPEPSTAVLLLGGVGALLTLRRRARA